MAAPNRMADALPELGEAPAVDQGRPALILGSDRRGEGFVGVTQQRKPGEAQKAGRNLWRQFLFIPTWTSTSGVQPAVQYYVVALQRALSVSLTSSTLRPAPRENVRIITHCDAF